MMKLKRYLKPYIGFALAAIVLMFCQAAVDLNLPNLMSDIVMWASSRAVSPRPRQKRFPPRACS